LIVAPGYILVDLGPHRSPLNPRLLTAQAQIPDFRERRSRGL